MEEIYLVQAEYLDKVHGSMVVLPIGCTWDYAKAKEMCEKAVEEDKEEGQFPKDYDGWNEHYHDMFTYDDEMSRACIYVCSVDVM